MGQPRVSGGGVASMRRRGSMRAASIAFLAVLIVSTVVAVLPGSSAVRPTPVAAEEPAPGLLLSAAIREAQPPPVPIAELGIHRFPALADLTGRAAPRLDARTVRNDAYLMGQDVPVVCQLSGGRAYGSRIWDLTSHGYYVTDSYVRTGDLGFATGVPRCTGQERLPSRQG